MRGSTVIVRLPRTVSLTLTVVLKIPESSTVFQVFAIY